MANAVLYYRDASTLTTPIDNLLSAQRLIYDAPDDVLEAVTEVYENRINPQQSVNSQGVRRIFLRDDGLKNRRFIIRGRMLKTSTDIPKIKSFRKMQQALDTGTPATSLPHGVFGIRIDNADFYNIDPNTSRGLMIGRVTIGYVGNKPTRYGFEIELFFGGEHE